MVDTALVSDLIYSASQYDEEWLLVVGDDIDLVPGIFTAESFLNGTGRKVIYMRSEDHWCVKCNDLILR